MNFENFKRPKLPDYQSQTVEFRRLTGCSRDRPLGTLIDGSDACSREVGRSHGASALVHQSELALGRAVNALGPCGAQVQEPS
jgi:hypothetical protein